MNNKFLKKFIWIGLDELILIGYESCNLCVKIFRYFVGRLKFVYIIILGLG